MGRQWWWKTTSRSLTELARPLWRSSSTRVRGGDLKDRVRVSFGRIARLVTWIARADGLVFGRWILLSRAAWHEMERGSHWARALLAHELVHVEQYRRLGLFRFLARYVREYLSGRRQGLSHLEAYRAISLEKEARERSAGISAELP